MIEIKKTKHMNPLCNCCNSENNVMALVFKNGNHGTELTICESCRNELIKLLKETENNHA